MFLMIKCVMNAMVLDVMENLPLFSVQTSLVYSIIVNSAGQSFMQDLVVNSTSLLSKKVETDLGKVALAWGGK